MKCDDKNYACNATYESKEADYEMTFGFMKEWTIKFPDSKIRSYLRDKPSKNNKEG